MEDPDLKTDAHLHALLSLLLLSLVTLHWSSPLANDHLAQICSYLRPCSELYDHDLFLDPFQIRNLISRANFVSKFHF